jgi:hypothetical protein
MLSQMRARTALAVLAASVAGLSACGGPNRAAYVEANQRIFDTLPRPPGAVVVSTTSGEVRGGESGPILGYLMLVELALPHDITARDITEFYRARMAPSWRLVEALDGPVLNFRRDDACVSVNAENWRVRKLEVAVDHACA